MCLFLDSHEAIPRFSLSRAALGSRPTLGLLQDLSRAPAPDGKSGGVRHQGAALMSLPSVEDTNNHQGNRCVGWSLQPQTSAMKTIKWGERERKNVGGASFSQVYVIWWPLWEMTLRQDLDNNAQLILLKLAPAQVLWVGPGVI